MLYAGTINVSYQALIKHNRGIWMQGGIWLHRQLNRQNKKQQPQFSLQSVARVDCNFTSQNNLLISELHHLIDTHTHNICRPAEARPTLNVFTKIREWGGGGLFIYLLCFFKYFSVLHANNQGIRIKVFYFCAWQYVSGTLNSSEGHWKNVKNKFWSKTQHKVCHHRGCAAIDRAYKLLPNKKGKHSISWLFIIYTP